MKLQQLRYLVEVARRGLNVSEAALALHTSQPGVSKQIRALEDELGVEVFERRGKRLTALTEPGKAVIEIAERVLAETANLKRAGAEFADEKLGTLTVATTHTQARYALPQAVAAFKRRYPGVRLLIHQGNPTQICEQVIAGEADLAIATEAIADHPERLAKDLAPNVVLTALDADVIKTYVELGLGVGIMAQMAFDAKRDRGLRAIDASHLFESSTTRLGIKRGAWLRRYAYDFIEFFAPHLPRALVERAARGDTGAQYDL